MRPGMSLTDTTEASNALRNSLRCLSSNSAFSITAISALRCVISASLAFLEAVIPVSTMFFLSSSFLFSSFVLLISSPFSSVSKYLTGLMRAANCFSSDSVFAMSAFMFGIRKRCSSLSWNSSLKLSRNFFATSAASTALAASPARIWPMAGRACLTKIAPIPAIAVASRVGLVARAPIKGVSTLLTSSNPA